MVLLPPRFQASHKRPRLSSASVSAACLSGIFGTRVVVSRPELNENKKRYEFSRLDQEQCRFGDFVAFIVHGSVGLLQMDIFNTYQLHTFPSSTTYYPDNLLYTFFVVVELTVFMFPIS